MVSTALGSSTPPGRAGPAPPSQRPRLRPRSRSVWKVGVMRRGEDDRGGAAASPDDRALLLLDEPLAVDAVAREGQRLEALVGDRLAAALAVAERAVLDLLERGDDVAQDPPVAVAQLEEELPGVGGVGLIPEILDCVVFLLCCRVERGASGVGGELLALLEQLLLEARQSFLFHHDLRGDRES